MLFNSELIRSTYSCNNITMLWCTHYIWWMSLDQYQHSSSSMHFSFKHTVFCNVLGVEAGGRLWDAHSSQNCTRFQVCLERRSQQMCEGILWFYIYLPKRDHGLPLRPVLTGWSCPIPSVVCTVHQTLCLSSLLPKARSMSLLNHVVIVLLVWRFFQGPEHVWSSTHSSCNSI